MDEQSVILVARCRRGDQVASKELFDRYVSRLITLVHRRMSSRLARRVDAEDIVQSAFRSFFVGIEKEKLQIDQTGDLWRLLVVMSLNKLRRRATHHQAAKRGMDRERSVDANLAADDAYIFETAASEPLPDAAAAVLDEFALVTQDLEPYQSEIVRLRMYGYEMTEIADAVGRSERTVRRVLDKIRSRWVERSNALVR